MRVLRGVIRLPTGSDAVKDEILTGDGVGNTALTNAVEKTKSSHWVTACAAIQHLSNYVITPDNFYIHFANTSWPTA